MVTPVAPAVAAVVIPAAVAAPAPIMPAMVVAATVAAIAVPVVIMDAHETGFGLEERHRLGTRRSETDGDGEAGHEGAAALEESSVAKSHDGLPICQGRNHAGLSRTT